MAKATKSKKSEPKKRFRRTRRFFGYFVEARQELKKVTWPSRKQTWKLTFAVIVFTGFFTVLTLLLDSGFRRVAEELFL